MADTQYFTVSPERRRQIAEFDAACEHYADTLKHGTANDRRRARQWMWRLLREPIEWPFWVRSQTVEGRDDG